MEKSDTLNFISAFAAQAAHVQKAQELERLKTSEMKDLLEKTNMELDAMKEVAEILYDMCQRLGAMVDSRDDGQKPQASSFDMMLNTAMARLELRKAGFDYQELQEKLKELQVELLAIHKRYHIPDTEMIPAV